MAADVLPRDEAIRQTRKAIRALRLEAPAAVVDDVERKVEDAFAALLASNPERDRYRAALEGVVGELRIDRDWDEPRDLEYRIEHADRIARRALEPEETEGDRG